MSSASSHTGRSLTDDLKEFARTLNKSPTKREFAEYGPHSVWVYKKKFGSWNEALKAADLEPNLVHNISSETLKDDIERVAGVLDKAPTLNELDQFGKYNSQTYTQKLGSYVETLEELGLDPTPRQYNFSSKEPPREKQGTKNVRKLRKEGPLSSSELPHDSFGVKDKMHGMATFSINTGDHGNSEAIYYLFDDHKPEDVLRVFLETHPETLENRSTNVITRAVGRYGKSWKEAAQNVLSAHERPEHRE